MADTVRVSLVFPQDLWEEVKRLIPSGERSRVIAAATEREIRRRQRLESIERLRALQEEFRRKYGEMPSCVEDIRQMREERDADITGLR
jgi:metal-responsive CopG/Arc/MetJ family transcriptional regulator